MKNVAVIIVNWNGLKDTLNCLSSLVNIRHDGINVELIVVDNGSNDGSAVGIRRKYPDTILIENKDNLGFSGGSNSGIQKAIEDGADYVWLVNNDTYVDPHALEALVTVFHDSENGIAGSKIYFSAGHEYHRDRYSESDRGKVFWYAGGIIDWKNMYASHRGVDLIDSGQYDRSEETDFVTGCSMMIRKEVIRKIGLFDNGLYLYLEDLDYCLRAKASGFRLIYVPQSVMWHVNAGSSAGPGNPLQEYYQTRNRLVIGFRYAPLRTKFALFREAIRQIASTNAVKKRAVSDALFGRMGGRFKWEKS
jgi:GT2 family glycosyltransferase